MPPQPAERKQAAQRHGFVATLVAWYSWWVYRVCKAGLDACEEWSVGVLRESLQISQRAINGASAWTLSVFNRDYKTQLRGRWATLQEQYSGWGRAESGRGSTLNAVLARKFDEDGTPPASDGTAKPAAAAPAGVSHEGLRQRKHHTSSSQAGSQQPHFAQQHPPSVPSSAQGQPAGISEIEPLPLEGFDPATAPQHKHPQHPHQQQGAGLGSASEDAGASQWWGGKGWLSEIADEATEAAAAAQEAATAAVQQAATTMTHAVEEAAATAASWARSMRGVFVEPPAGWGVHEAIKQTGLLEDVSLHGQLFISRIFDKLRWLLGKLTFSSVGQTPTAAAQQHFSSSSQAGGGSAKAESGGLFGMLRSPRHPASRAAVGPGAAGVTSFGVGFAAGRRWKLRSVTSVDLPRTRRISLEAEDSDDQQDRAADESCFSDSSSDAYDDVQEDASSEASCSSSSSWTHHQQQHGPSTAAALQAATAAGRMTSAEVATAPAHLADLPGPPLTVRVPNSALNDGSSSGRVGQGRVSFAAPTGRRGPAAAAVAGGAGDPTPFASLQVQQQHEADITQLQQHGAGPQSAVPAAGASSPAGKAAKPHKSSSRGSSSSSRHRQRVPEGLGAVLPGRGNRRLQRSHSGPAVSVLKDVSSAGQVIRMAGYPLEVHEVVTADGYLLRMERIPHPSATDAVFMMHGVLDTSLTWVAGGITGSQAFAAWDRGFDVWLGTSRSNPPHEAADPARRGSAYWVYSHNEVGLYDMGAQMDHIHAVKMRELTALGRNPSSSSRRASSSSEPATAAKTGRQPSSRRSSSSTTAGSRRPPIPEHADVLEGVVDADVLVGIQHVRPSSGLAGSAREIAGKPGHAPAGAADAGQTDPGFGVQGGSAAAGGAVSEPMKADSGAATATGAGGDSGGSGRAGAVVDISRSQSAAEIDQEAAAEAAVALTRHRAALAAAGISPGISSSAAAAGLRDQTDQQQFMGHQDGQQQQLQQQQAQPQGVLSTPTALTAASAAARAANAFGSAVATAAAAAGGIIGMAAAGGSSSNGAADASAVPAAVPFLPQQADADNQQQQGQHQQQQGRVSTSRDSSTTMTAKPAASSGLMERLLGGTVQLGEDAVGFGRGGSGPRGAFLQSQGSGMRHVSSAPDVSALTAGLQDGVACGVPDAGVSGEGGEVGSVHGSSGSGSGSGSSGGGGVEVGAAGSARRARRGSCPYFTAESAARSNVQQLPADAGELSVIQPQPQQQQPQQQHPDNVLDQQQDVQGASPFSLQQPAQAQAIQPQPMPQQPQQHPGAKQQHPPLPQPPQQQAQPVLKQNQQVSSPTAAAAAAASTAASAASGHRGGAPAEGRAVRSSDWGLEPRPYNLRVVCHSLGGLLLLIYCTQRARIGRPHHISRLIMLSPAGFHPVIPSMFKPLVYVWRPLMLWTQLVWRQQGFPVQLPTFVARMLAFKLSIDSSKLPAVGDLLRSMARLLLGGDRSAWDRALLMPHYTAAGMPLLSSRQVLHFIQLYLTGRCQLYDYGSEAANVAHYQQRTPPVVSDSYHMLRDVPVHLVAGQHDGVIPASNIRYHHAAMSSAGMDVSYREFEYGHMDFTFSAKEELGWYVMSLLMRT